MQPRERLTLEIGSAIVLSTLMFGLQFGRWPAWSAAVALMGYLAWTVLYSELTIQAAHRVPFWERLRPVLRSAAEAPAAPG